MKMLNITGMGRDAVKAALNNLSTEKANADEVERITDNWNLYDYLTNEPMLARLDVNGRLEVSEKPQAILLEVEKGTQYRIRCPKYARKRIAFHNVHPTPGTSYLTGLVSELTDEDIVVTSRSNSLYMVVTLVLQEGESQDFADYWSVMQISRVSAEDRVARERLDAVEEQQDNMSEQLSKAVSEFDRVWTDFGNITSKGDETEERKMGLEAAISYKGYFNKSQISSSSTARMLAIRCETETRYTVSKLATAKLRLGTARTEQAPKNGAKVYGFVSADGLDGAEITTDADAVWLLVYYYSTADENEYTEAEVLESLEITEWHRLPTAYDKVARSAVDKLTGGKQMLFGAPSLYVSEDVENRNINDMTPDEVYAEYDELAENHPNWVRREADIGMDSDGNGIRHYTVRMQDPLTNDLETPGKSVNTWERDYDYTEILVVAGVHGDEKNAVYGTALFFQELMASTEDWARYIRGNFIIHVVPLVSVWGFENFSRNNKDGVNINRDYYKLTTSEARAILGLIEQLGPTLKVILDMHDGRSKFSYMSVSKAATGENRKNLLRIGARFAGMDMAHLAAVYNNEATYPYFYPWQSINDDTLNDWAVRHGYMACTLETPRSVTGGENNYCKACSITKDMLGNFIQLFGANC